MRNFPTQRFGPWSGINTVADSSELPPGALLDAVNVDVTADGAIESSISWERVAQGSAHSLVHYEGRTYGVLDGVIHSFDVEGAEPIAPCVGEVWWREIRGELTYVDASGLFQLLPEHQRYPGYAADDGDLDDVIVEMPGGRFLTYWAGRAVVASGRRLLFSRPLRYGAHNPLLDYYTMPKRVTWLEALPDGIYVGQPDSVEFLAGTALGQLTRRTVAGRSAEHAYKLVPMSMFREAGDGQAVVFLTERGFALGLQGGTVQYPQAAALRELPLFRGRLVVFGNRVYALRG